MPNPCPSCGSTAEPDYLVMSVSHGTRVCECGEMWRVEFDAWGDEIEDIHRDTAGGVGRVPILFGHCC